MSTPQNQRNTGHQDGAGTPDALGAAEAQDTVGPRTISRRALAQGAAWSVPALAVSAAAAPAFAASGNTATATNVTFYAYGTRETSYTSTCNTSTNFQKGYIDTMPDTTGGRASYISPVGNSDGRRDPTTSNGVWFESAGGGTVTIQSISLTYNFYSSTTTSSPLTVKLINCPSDAAGTANTDATGDYWTTCNILNGWTATQPTTNSIKFTFTGPLTVQTSTATAGSGWATGFFANYYFPNSCPLANVYGSVTKTVSYIDASGQVKTSTTTTSITKIPG